MGIKITAPSNYTGASVYGDTTLKFDNGVAEVDSLSKEVGLWLKNKGYKLIRVKGKSGSDKTETGDQSEEEVNDDGS